MTMRGLLFFAVVLLPGVALAGLSPKEIYKKAGPGVVLILGGDGGLQGTGGTGSIISTDGKVITNAHVVVNGETGQPYRTLKVYLKPATITGDNKRDLIRALEARVLYFSGAKQLDLALVQIVNAPAGLTVIPFADPELVEVGDEVVAIGHPEQGGLWTLTTGTISTLIANFGRISGKDVFQTEASVNRGNSGGPLLDTNGHMVGINTLIARQGSGGMTITDVNFSLKSSVAVKWLAGRGMGVAYAPEDTKSMTVAVAPILEHRDQDPGVDERESSSLTPEGDGPTRRSRQQVMETPPSTIVVTEPVPQKHEVKKIRSEGQTLGTTRTKEEVVSGEKLDPNKARPTYHTRKRPFSIDELRRAQIQELEDMMDEFRGRSTRRVRGKRTRR